MGTIRQYAVIATIAAVIILLAWVGQVYISELLEESSDKALIEAKDQLRREFSPDFLEEEPESWIQDFYEAATAASPRLANKPDKGEE